MEETTRYLKYKTVIDKAVKKYRMKNLEKVKAIQRDYSLDYYYKNRVRILENSKKKRKELKEKKEKDLISIEQNEPLDLTC